MKIGAILSGLIAASVVIVRGDWAGKITQHLRPVAPTSAWTLCVILSGAKDPYDTTT